jgi:hypothetical protein
MQGYIDTGQNEGMISMKQSLERLLLAGVITENEANMVAPTAKKAEAMARDPLDLLDYTGNKHSIGRPALSPYGSKI